jgi:hypothetical protein
MKKTMALFGISALLLAVAPAFASAAVSTQVLIPSLMTSNLKTDFYVQAQDIPAGNLRSKIIIENASLADVGSLEYWTGSQWVAGQLTGMGNEVASTNSFVSTSVNYRIVLKTNKQFVVGYVLENATNSNVISSASMPVTTTGTVLGEQVSNVPIPLPMPGVVLPAGKFMFNKNLTSGNRNSDVTELQKVLVSLGLLKAEPNGIFGPQTLAAVRKYQASNGLPTTGFVGPQTRAALNK